MEALVHWAQDPPLLSLNFESSGCSMPMRVWMDTVTMWLLREHSKFPQIVFGVAGGGGGQVLRGQRHLHDKETQPLSC